MKFGRDFWKKSLPCTGLDWIFTQLDSKPRYSTGMDRTVVDKTSRHSTQLNNKYEKSYDCVTGIIYSRPSLHQTRLYATKLKWTEHHITTRDYTQL